MARSRAPAGLETATRAASFNVRYDDAMGSAEERRGHAREVAEALRRLDADILCLQEVISLRGRAVAEENFLRRFLEAELQEWFGVFPDDGSRLSEAGPIFLRRRRYRVVEDGIFWFSDTPEVPDSVGWGNELPRFCTWVLAEEASSGKRLLAANVHLDHRSGRSRLRAARMLRSRLSRISGEAPILLAGDFNAGRGSRVQGELGKSYVRALRSREATLTVPLPRQIDQIFVSPGVRVLQSFILKSEERQRRGRHADHRPCAADLVIPQREKESSTDATQQ